MMVVGRLISDAGTEIQGESHILKGDLLEEIIFQQHNKKSGLILSVPAKGICR
jgi:hypothetical protein